MATSSSLKVPCATCENKGVGVFKCEGCSQIFCRKHSNEHRDLLIHQLDEIVLEHDTLHQTIMENKAYRDHRHHLMEQIDKWERDSIAKIQQTAREIRQQVEKVVTTETEPLSAKLHDLAERLRRARVDDDFVETDLQLWTTKLQELKIETVDINPTVTIREDKNITLVAQLSIAPITKRSVHGEGLMRVFGNAQIKDDNCMAIQLDSSKISYVCGRKKYSSGSYKIRFTMNKKKLSFSTVFGIVSRSETLSEWPSSFYGWSNDDYAYFGGEICSNGATAESDMNGKTTFTIELLLDCDNRKIKYFNEETKNTRELNIKLNICPFPWQLFFYLHDVGDCVRLL